MSKRPECFERWERTILRVWTVEALRADSCRRLLPFLAAAAAICVPTTVGAEDGILLTVVPGAGGVVREGAMAPVHVLVENRGSSILAVVTLHWLDASGRTPPVTEFQEIQLPQSSAKRLAFYSQPGFATREVRVAVRDYEPGSNPNSGRLHAEFREAVRLIEAESPVLGVLGTPFAALPRPTDADGKEWGSRFYFSTDWMPDDARGWEMCDAIIFGPDAHSSPTVRELGALREWVFQGGDLVIIASEPGQVFVSPAFRDFLPYVPSGQQQTRIGLFDAETLHSVGQIDGGEVILRDGGTPLIIARKYGLGAIYELTFDPSATQFSESSMVVPVWRQTFARLYEVPTGDQRSMMYSAYDEFTEMALDAVTETPDVRLRLFVVVLLIGLYAAAVGPGDYLLARRFKRPMLTWITFPSMVLIFTSLAFLGARAWVGGEQTVIAHHSVTYFPEGALHNRTVGFFAAASRNYELDTGSTGSLRRLALTLDEPDQAWVDNESGVRLQRVPTWSARVFTSVYRDDATAGVDFEVRENEQGILLNVTNRGDWSVRVIALTCNGRQYVVRPSEIPSLTPGASGSAMLPARRGSKSRSANQAGQMMEIWNEGMTRAACYRSRDHRKLVSLRDTVLSFEILDPALSAMNIDGMTTQADGTTIVGHVVHRNPMTRNIAIQNLQEEP